MGHKRENNYTQDLSLLRPSKTVRKANSQVMKLVDFGDVSWIWDNKKDISELPDDILVNILSRLTLTQAVRTSVISSRWKHLWRFFSGTVHIDSSKTFRSLPNQQRRFVNRVTKALRSLPNPSLEELKICFLLDPVTYKSNIDSWVKFAMKTRVKRFCLDLNFRTYPANNYNFPLQSLGSSMCISLTALHLKFVHVTAKVTEHLLSKCPFLEDLCVVSSTGLRNLKICGPSLKLKYLKLMYNEVETIEISAVNLISFKYYGKETSVSFKDVPHLTDVSFGESYTSYIIKSNFSNLSLVASQLETVALELHSWYQCDLTLWMYNNCLDFPNFNNIKQLQLTVLNKPLLNLLDGFPSLQMLSLQLNWKHYVVVPPRSKHPCLRVLEIVGFMGYPCDVELAMCLFYYAKSLEKIIIDTRNSFADEERLNTARSTAQDLGREVPTGAKLLIH